MNDTFAVLVNLSPYHGLEEGLAWFEALKGRAEHDGLAFYIALPYDLLNALTDTPAPSFLILGSKFMNPVLPPGCFTETIASQLVKSFGAKFVLLGTQSTRKLEGESHAAIAEKIKRAKAEGLIPVLCVGETAEEFQQQKASEVLTRQISEATQGLDAAALSGLQIVYEAPWIAAAPSRPPEQEIDQAYQFCRNLVHSLLGANRVKVYCPVPADLKEADAFIHTVHADGFYFTDPHQLAAIDEASLRAKAAAVRHAREVALEAVAVVEKAVKEEKEEAVAEKEEAAEEEEAVAEEEETAEEEEAVEEETEVVEEVEEEIEEEEENEKE